MSESNFSTTPQRSMKKWLVPASLILLAGGGLVLWLAGGFRREPLHKGKPISYWVDQACTGYDGTRSDGNDVWVFRREVNNIGPAAVPYLVARLRTSDRWRNAWLRLRASLPARIQQRFSDTRS